MTGISIDGQQVPAVPRETAVAELRTAALLAKASTFGEVRQDADAADLVEQHLREYRGNLLYSPELADVEDNALRGCTSTHLLTPWEGGLDRKRP